MVVFIVHQLDILADEPEGNPPVCLHRDRPITSSAAFQFVKPVAGEIEIVRSSRHIQIRENPLQLFSMTRLDARLATGIVKPFQPFMNKTDDHSLM